MVGSQNIGWVTKSLLKRLHRHAVSDAAAMVSTKQFILAWSNHGSTARLPPNQNLRNEVRLLSRRRWWGLLICCLVRVPACKQH